MKTFNTLLLFLIAITNSFASTYSGGSGTSGDPYQIATTTDLIELSNTSADWDKHFIQIADIAFNADETQVDWNNSGSTGPVEGFSPIGIYNNPYGSPNGPEFTGSYDGDGYTIDNLYIDRSEENVIGLFGSIDGATISNLGVTNVNITGDGSVGSLVAFTKNATTVSNSYSTGSVSGSANVGGLVGYNSSGTINNSYSTCSVIGNRDNIGGLVGSNNNSSSVENSYSTGSVEGSGAVGGLVGWNYGASIKISYSTGNVTSTFNSGGSNDYVGGLVGSSNGGGTTISNCYSTGSVTRSSSSVTGTWFGSFCGFNAYTIKNCYSIGSVFESDGVTWSSGDKGFVGYDSGGSYTNNFWDSEVSNQSTATGATAKNTSQMKTQATFIDWDFSTIWGLDPSINDGYPNLLNYNNSAEITWTGNTSTDWNTSSNWSENAVPASIDNVTIPESLSNYPEIDNSPASPAICNNMTIETNVQVDILSNSGLTISGDLTNNGTINILSNASGEGSLIVNGTLSGSGTYNVQRYLSGSQWHLVTSPITAGTSGVFENIWLRPYDEAENDFGEYITPTTTPMPVGQGYSVWADAAETRTFTGTINHGAIGPLSAQLSGAAGENSGWNLMGNPYPSAIDWDAGSGWTRNNLANSVYVWNSTQYANYIDGIGTNGGSRYIASGQGFFVQATSAGASLSMDNDIRVHNSINFLKNTQTDPENTIRVTISADGYQDENVIAIREANANAYDPQTDAYKLPGSADAPQMHIEKDDFSELSIASFPQIQDIDATVLNIDYAMEGTHTILWSHTCTENTPALLDQQTGQIIEPGSNYTFTASFSDMQDRFVFTTDLLSIQDKLNTLDVWEYNNTVFVKSNTDNSKISVFNMQGVNVYSNTGNEFDLNHLAPAMYLVKVKSGENQKIEKVIIK